MPSTWSKVLLHVVFSTKNREPLITPALRERLDPFIGGILRDLGASLISAGGMPDHTHLLMRVGTDRSIAEVLRHVKSRSSKWVHDDMAMRDFAWQVGYGVFSVSQSAAEDVSAYVQNQEQHHRARDFKEEFLSLLKLHEVEYDPKYAFD